MLDGPGLDGPGLDAPEGYAHYASQSQYAQGPVARIGVGGACATARRRARLGTRCDEPTVGCNRQ
jgi:hypothetical protein